MEGRAKTAPFPASAGVPVLTADPAAGVSMTQAARDALLKLQNLLAENSEPLHSTLNNLNTFSAALARNSDRLDSIITGVERLTGTGPAAAPSGHLRPDRAERFPRTQEGAGRPVQRSRADRAC